MSHEEQIIIMGETSDGVYQTPKLDTNSRVLVTIDYEHHGIHRGDHYFITGFETLALNASVIFAVTTPNTTQWAHMRFRITGTSQTEFYMYEGATITGGTGTAATPINSDRNSTNTSSLTVTKNPTVTVQGTLISSSSTGLAGATPSKADNEGILDRDDEIILKQNTTYLFEIKSIDDDNIVAYHGKWYEHTNLA